MAVDPLEASVLTHDGDAACPVTVYTVATRHSMGAHNLLASLRRYGYRYRVLAWGQAWGGWRHRMTLYRDAAAAHAPTDVLVFLDAYDVVAARPWRGIAEAFAAFGAPLVTGMEALCSPENCGNLAPWWAATRRTPRTRAKYVNGGCIVGTAAAIAAAYRWILADARHFTDDQIGLAAYINAHPEVYAPDDARVLCSNKLALQRMTDDERDGKGAYFLHFPGLSKAPPLFPITPAWRVHAGALAIVEPPRNWNWDAIRWGSAVAAACLLLALGVACGLALGKAKYKQDRA